MGIISIPYPIKKQKPLIITSNKISGYAAENATIINNLINKMNKRYIRSNPSRNWEAIYNIVDKGLTKKYLCNTECKCPEIILNVTAIINKALLNKKSLLKLYFT